MIRRLLLNKWVTPTLAGAAAGYWVGRHPQQARRQLGRVRGAALDRASAIVDVSAPAPTPDAPEPVTEMTTESSDDTVGEQVEQVDGLVDEMVDESFPGSDPPSTWAGPPR